MRSVLCGHTMNPSSRRDFLQRSAAGFGWLAFSALQSISATAAQRRTDALAPKTPHHVARAKRVIFLFMEGGPSHLESFDWRPELARVGGDARSRYLAPVFPFRPHGKSGLMISDAYPELAKQADHLCLLNGMHTQNPGHHQAVVALHTGNENFVRPSMGSWITYGLGSEAESLPGFVTINPIVDKGGAANYGSAFLPATFQGTRIGSASRGVPHIRNRRLTREDQRAQLHFVQQINQRMKRRNADHPDIDGLIQSAELAFRMQSSVPEALNLSAETRATRSLYGLDDRHTAPFGTQCLMARRLAERGVRFIQLTSTGWDHHSRMREAFELKAGATDRPIAGLIRDLAQRDLLRDTLLVWGGEFGRQANPDNNGGRGHNNKGFTMWMAGGGVRGGYRHGATDDLGRVAVSGRMGTHDLHATILHLLGLDHEQLTYQYSGRDFRLTDVAGTVAHDIMT